MTLEPVTPSLTGVPGYSDRVDEVTSAAGKTLAAEPRDYRRLPEPLDLSDTVTTWSTEAAPFEPDPIWASPEIAGMARTNALG